MDSVPEWVACKARVASAVLSGVDSPIDIRCPIATHRHVMPNGTMTCEPPPFGTGVGVLRIGGKLMGYCYVADSASG